MRTGRVTPVPSTASEPFNLTGASPPRASISMNWRQAADAYGITTEELKEELPLEWLIGKAAGVLLADDGPGRAVGFCPFHDDYTPSLDLYRHGTRWGCFPCGKGGDLFDFVGDFWQINTFSARLEKAIQLYAEFRDGDSEWTGNIKAADLAEVVTDEVVYQEYLSAFNNFETVAYPIAQLLQRKGGLLAEIPPFWLHASFHLGVTDDLEVMAPHFRMDGAVSSYKTRWPGRGGWYARSGRKLSELYGVQNLQGKDNSDLPVWICEGETDTWLASYLLRGRGVALGLPRGAMSHIEAHWVEQLTDRRVTLVFDDDNAGRAAAHRWHDALVGRASEILIAFPDGDLCETARPELTLDSGLTVNPASGFITDDANRTAYHQVQPSGSRGDKISNWILDPTRSIIYLALDGSVEEYGFEGHFTNDIDSKRLIRSRDLQNVRSAIGWSNGERRVWLGTSSKQTQSVLEELNARAPFLPRIRAVAMVGLHGVDEGMPVFVLPEESGGVIGSPVARDRWLSYEDGTPSDYSDHFTMMPVNMSAQERAVWGTRVAQALMTLNTPDVVTPILAWLCAAPLRSSVDEFPPLAVMGGSGSGKTTMLKWMLTAFYGTKEEHNLSAQSTPYGLTAWATGTNALPIWYDEYRTEAKRENLDAINQMIRDAWTASSSSRGGIGEDKSKVHNVRITAPLIISGESAFTERSHIDRMVIIQLPDQNAEAGRNPDALAALIDCMDVVGSLGRLYLEWVVNRLGRDQLPGVQIELDRQEQGENVLEWGWSMWCEFCEDVFGMSIDSKGLDLTNIREERSQSDEHPILTALEACIQREVRDDRGWPLAWVTDPGNGVALSRVAVRTTEFHRWAEREGYMLPGIAKSTRLWLKKRFNVKNPSQQLEYWDFLGRHQPRGMYLIGAMEAISEEHGDEPTTTAG